MLYTMQSWVTNSLAKQQWDLPLWIQSEGSLHEIVALLIGVGGFQVLHASYTLLFAAALEHLEAATYAA